MKIISMSQLGGPLVYEAGMKAVFGTANALRYMTRKIAQDLRNKELQVRVSLPSESSPVEDSDIRKINGPASARVRVYGSTGADFTKEYSMLLGNNDCYIKVEAVAKERFCDISIDATCPEFDAKVERHNNGLSTLPPEHDLTDATNSLLSRFAVSNVTLNGVTESISADLNIQPIPEEIEQPIEQPLQMQASDGLNSISDINSPGLGKRHIDEIAEQYGNDNQREDSDQILGEVGAPYEEGSHGPLAPDGDEDTELGSRGKVYNIERGAAVDLDVPPRRQQTQYTCGPAALRSVLAAFDVKMDEDELTELLESTPEDGTSPDSLYEIAAKLKLNPAAKEGMTIEELTEATKNGNPVIILFQAWKESDTAWSQDWNDGHYAVVTAVDDNNVHLTDPSLEGGSRGFVPVDEFTARWHDTDGDEDFHHWGMILNKQADKVEHMPEEKISSLSMRAFIRWAAGEWWEDQKPLTPRDENEVELSPNGGYVVTPNTVKQWNDEPIPTKDMFTLSKLNRPAPHSNETRRKNLQPQPNAKPEELPVVQGKEYTEVSDMWRDMPPHERQQALVAAGMRKDMADKYATYLWHQLDTKFQQWIKSRAAFAIKEHFGTKPFTRRSFIAAMQSMMNPVMRRWAQYAIFIGDDGKQCDGECRGTGKVPVKENCPEEPWRSLWTAAEDKVASSDGWHFVECPECHGSGTQEFILPSKHAVALIDTEDDENKYTDVDETRQDQSIPHNVFAAMDAFIGHD